jgi:hypothetical protein
MLDLPSHPFLLPENKTISGPLLFRTSSPSSCFLPSFLPFLPDHTIEIYLYILQNSHSQRERAGSPFPENPPACSLISLDLSSPPDSVRRLSMRRNPQA